MRTTTLGDEDFIRQYFDDGTQHTGVLGDAKPT